ncbi:MAG: hypothetical protein AMXMBFR61_21130 [Fimbriimonadales bacterium]
MSSRRHLRSETDSIGQEAVAAVTAWHERQCPPWEVTDVQRHAAYKKIDVDLPVKAQGNEYSIEVKGDRWDSTGNLFHETVSNAELRAPGCFS